MILSNGTIVPQNPIRDNYICVICDGPRTKADAEALICHCDTCREKMLACSECESDDVRFDWQINVMTNDVEWIAICDMCEFNFVGSYDSPKEVYESWQNEGMVQSG